MRNLKVTRRKSFVGCIATIKLCTEAHENENSDITIDGMRCRIIG